MIQWFVRNGVAANLLMMIILAAGLASMSNIKMELFPEMDLDIVTVRVPYPGSTPQETEDAICVRIEEAVYDLDGIKKMTSIAQEGIGVVTLELMRGADARALLSDVKTRVDAIDTFPDEAEKAIVDLPLIKQDVITLTIHGNADEKSLKVFAESVRDEIVNLPGISQVDIFGVRDYEIAIELSEIKLREYGMTFSDVVGAIREASVDLPGGSIRSEGGEVLLRSDTKAYNKSDFEALVLRTFPDGSRLLVGDVAKVVDGFVDEPIELFFDNRRAVALRVYEVADQNILHIAKTVKAYVKEKNASLPEGLTIDYWGDWSFYLKGRLQMLIENGLIGLILVFALLTLFLRPSLALWVTLGIPVSFLGAFIIMPFFDISINIISLFGLIMVLGIVVDDAIVVGESVFSKFQEHGPGVEASIKGSHEVAVPVTFAVLTTAVAFTPILMLPGFQGKFMHPIPFVVIGTLFFSLIESKLILPYHLTLCNVGSGNRASLGRFQRFQRKIADGLERFVEHVFRPLLGRVLECRYLALSVFVAMLAIVITLIQTNRVKVVMFPSPPSDYIMVNMSMVEGTVESQTRIALNRVIDAMDEVIAELETEGYFDPIEHSVRTLGSQPFGGGPGDNATRPSGSNIAQVMVEMQKSENRLVSAPDFAARWRDKLQHLPGIKELSFKSRAADAGMPIDIELTGKGFEVLEKAADDLKQKLAEYSAVFDIRDNFSGGKRELELVIKPSAQLLGISQADLAQQVRFAFYGAEAQRIQRGRDDVKVMVRYPEADRRSLDTLKHMRIRTKDGREVPFYEVADIVYSRSPSAITRVARHRVINVQADAEKSSSALEEIKEELENEYLPTLVARYPGLRWSFQGEAKEGKESSESLASGSILVLCVIYVLMAIPFKSYLQPLIIMSVIPFGLIGAVGGHVLLDLPISMLSMLGIIAMAGVLVNDSLVLVDYINKVRIDKGDVAEAVRMAGVRRFRPILLTSLTTFAGLSPILLEKSLQAQFLIPMAASLAFGVLFGTLVTLLLVPSCYLILEDIKGGFRKLKSALTRIV